MSTQKVAVTTADGNVAIMSFVVEGRGAILPDGAEWLAKGRWRREATDENIVQEIFRAFATGPQPVSWQRVTDADIPTDRTYRDALTVTSGALVYDMNKAREVHMRNLRHERAAKMPALDVEWIKAFSRGDNDAAVAVEAKRQALRDFPVTMASSLNAATTTDELKALELPQ